MLLTKYQDFRTYGFRQEDVTMFFNLKAYVKHGTPGWGLFWPQGHNFNKFGRGFLVMLHTKYQGSQPYSF